VKFRLNYKTLEEDQHDPRQEITSQKRNR
jgi:hypothetical protein